MKDILFKLNNIRVEISFKSLNDLRSMLSFYQKNNLYKINIPCKNTLKKDFLLESIKISREEFPSIDIIPHFSILHEFRKNRINTQNSFIKFLEVTKSLGCNEVLLVSGSQRRTTLDSVSMLNFLKDISSSYKRYIDIGVAFNPYLPALLFNEEIKRLEKKLQSGNVSSIWIQFGTDYKLLESRIKILENLIDSIFNNTSKLSNINLFGSIFIPSTQFLARFKFRPWKGVYCSSEFLESVDVAYYLVEKLLKIYKKYNICPIIETNIYSDNNLESLKNIMGICT
ncbi:hypothetical protein [Prochlorococcus sp. MIT 0916]|uniref:hypothetical protein n=1 Tax=Prochlorococcus sp. MIT 0916 TaxID=3082521 RepID=UPI0039B69880